MQYRCPKCQSVKIMPVSQGVNSAKPVVPKKSGCLDSCNFCAFTVSSH